MKKLSQLFMALLAMTMITGILVSCGGDGTDPCTETDYEGTWVGKYKIAGLIPLPNNDTVMVTINGTTATITSQLLGGQSFTAVFDAATGEITIENLTIPVLNFGDESFTDISVGSGSIVLIADCSKLFMTLNQVSVAGGTVNLPSPLTYPLGPTELETTGTGFAKQL
jgi:hypothetical protein